MSITLNTGEQLDPQAVTLMKAIRQKESGGNYNAVGDAGTSTGAFQYQPETWKRYARDVLGDENAIQDRGNQNKVAYTKIKGWKDAGWSPEQVAAAWNAGEGKVANDAWRQNVGTTTINGQTIQYDTPKYVQDVIGIAKGLKQSEQVPNLPPQQHVEQTPQQQIGKEEIKQEEPKNKGLVDKLLDNPVTRGIQKFFPGQKVGESIGTLGGLAITKAKELTGAVPQGTTEQYDTSSPTPLQVAGDVAQGAVTIGAGFGPQTKALSVFGNKVPVMKTATGVLGNIGSGAKIGAALAGTGAVAEGESLGDVAKQTAIGGAIGGATGGVIGTIGKGIEKFVPNAQKTIQMRKETLSGLENRYNKVADSFKKFKNRDFIDEVLSETDLLKGAVDKTGNISTRNAQSELMSQLEPFEGSVKAVLEREGKTINVKKVEKYLLSKLKGGDVMLGGRNNARNEILNDIAGLAEEADSMGNIPISKLHDAKIYKYSNLNFNSPETKRSGKMIAQGLKELVEKNTDSIDVAKVNGELSKFYELLEALKVLNNRKVEGGKLGKYFAQTVGGIVGSHFGPLGTILGAETAAGLKGLSMSSKLGGATGKAMQTSSVLQNALNVSKLPPVKKLPIQSQPSEFTEELPVIEMGRGSKPKVDKKLPIIR